ncbi:Uncharacterized protein PHPALM_13526, partial [Phytophthora palmivora]
MLSSVRGRMMAVKRPLLRVVQFSSNAEGGGTEAEQAMHVALQKQLEAVHVKVTDVSGGCGSMFDVEVASITGHADDQFGELHERKI